MLGWIDAIDTRPEDGDRSTGAKRSTVRRGIDAAGQSAHDGDAARCEIHGQTRCGFERDRGSDARADDRDRWSIEHVQTSLIPERRWKVGEGAKPCREAWITPGQDVNAIAFGACADR